MLHVMTINSLGKELADWNEAPCGVVLHGWTVIVAKDTRVLQKSMKAFWDIRFIIQGILYFYYL